MAHYRVKDLMVKNPVIVSPDSNLMEAAQIMERVDCGVMPVGTPDKLVGMITDRDIAIRAVAYGKDPANTKVRDVMTTKVLSISAEAEVSQAADIIRKQKVNRLLVTDLRGKVAGIFSLSGLIRETADTMAITKFVHQLASTNHKKAA